MYDIQINIIPKWKIKGFEDYFFCTEKKLYNAKRLKELKPKLKGYTVGYNLNGKFISRYKLRSLIEKYEEVYCPF